MKFYALMDTKTKEFLCRHPDKARHENLVQTMLWRKRGMSSKSSVLTDEQFYERFKKVVVTVEEQS